MSPTLALVRDTSALAQRIALIACGENSRPGKTQACDHHLKKGSALLSIALTGAADALAAAICGTGRGPACHDCADKAARIIRVYNGESQ